MSGTFYRLREGIERFLITGINNPVLTAPGNTGMLPGNRQTAGGHLHMWNPGSTQETRRKEGVIKRTLLAIILYAAFLAPGIYAADDIVIADFEGGNYGRWEVEGEVQAEGALRLVVGRIGPARTPSQPVRC